MSGHKVLVVDDEPQIRRALIMALRGHGYEVEAAEDAQGMASAMAVRKVMSALAFGWSWYVALGPGHPDILFLTPQP